MIPTSQKQTTNGDLEDQRIFDDKIFRETLSHYPTGVAVITTDTEEGPVGMVVGSFTSVSLRPPLVAFLADHNSKTYAKIKDSDKFVINILSAQQEHLCRRFSSRTIEDKWDGVEWSHAGNGIRKLSGAVAHIECTHAGVYVAGDHDIVLCGVDHLSTDNPDLPLLFFQGAYGKFVPQSLVVPSQIDVAPALRVSDIAQPHLEQLAREFDVGCTALALVNGELIYVAAYQGSASSNSVPKVGLRLPHLPPLGTIFVAWAGEGAFEKWIAGAGPSITEQDRSDLDNGLRRVRERGYSVVLQSEEFDSLDRVRERFTNGQATPAEERFLKTVTLQLTNTYEPPEIEPRSVRIVSVPVLSKAGEVAMSMQVWNPSAAEGASFEEILDRLKVIAKSVETQLHARS